MYEFIGAFKRTFLSLANYLLLGVVNFDIVLRHRTLFALVITDVGNVT